MLLPMACWMALRLQQAPRQNTVQIQMQIQLRSTQRPTMSSHMYMESRSLMVELQSHLVGCLNPRKTWIRSQNYSRRLTRRDCALKGIGPSGFWNKQLGVICRETLNVISLRMWRQFLGVMLLVSRFLGPPTMDSRSGPLILRKVLTPRTQKEVPQLSLAGRLDTRLSIQEPLSSSQKLGQ